MFDQTEKANRIADDLKRIAALLAAFWPVCLWYAARTCDKSDEPWGLVALISLIGVLALGAKNESRRGRSVRKNAKYLENSIIGVVTLVAYLATFSIAPHLVQAVLFVLTLWYVAISRMALPSKTGALGLLLLSLPVIPSLNFFAGYPLRLLVANGVNIMLNILGIGADVNGVMLTVDGKFQAIDAPCSGISMFWVEFYVVMMLACVFKLNAKKTGIVTVIALPLIVLGNILRVTSIISFSKIISLPAGANLTHFEASVHLGSGLVVFCLVCLATIKVASILARPSEFAKVTSEDKRPEQDWSIAFAKVRHPFTTDFFPNFISQRLTTSLLFALCLACAFVPIVAHSTSSSPIKLAPPLWPREINGHKLVAVQSLEEEKVFARDFPGYMRRFTDGNNLYFIRFVQKETRQLHPSSDCFRGLGYSIEPLPITVSADGARWSTFEAAKDDSRYVIEERIFEATSLSQLSNQSPEVQGSCQTTKRLGTSGSAPVTSTERQTLNSSKSCTDVSEWYWLACLGRTKGPWFDVTIAKLIGRSSKVEKISQPDR